MPSRDMSAACSILRAAVAKLVTDNIRPVCVERTQLEQELEYAKGRTLPGRRVTELDGVTKLSRHQRQERHGELAVHAVDLGVFAGGRYLTDPAAYDPLGAAAESLGLEWGGRWRVRDRPHVQCVS